MYDIPEDCLLTYDPDHLDFHSDSTDFEDSQIQKVTNKNGNHSLISKSNKRSSKYFVLVNPFTYKANISNIKISKNSSKEMWEAETIYNQNGKETERRCYVNKKCKVAMDSGDQIQEVRSKRSIIRHKVIPCISGMFKRSGANKRMSVINELNKDDACQTFRVSYEPKMRKPNRTEQCYATQAVNESERKTHQNPHTKTGHRPLMTRKLQRSEYTNAQYSLTSSSEADRLEVLKKRDKNWKAKQVIEHEMKSHVDNMSKQKSVPEKQLRNNPTKRRKFPFQVYANPCQTSNPIKGGVDFGGSTTSAVPSSCSGFWDYLFNKINSKYQTPRPGSYKPCDCHHSNNSRNQNSPKPRSVSPYSVYSYAHRPCPPGTCVAELCKPKGAESPDDSLFDEADSCPRTPSPTTPACQANKPPPGGPATGGRPIQVKKCQCKNPRKPPGQQSPIEPRFRKRTVSPRPIPSPKRPESPKRTNVKSSPCSPCGRQKREDDKVNCECPSDFSNKTSSSQSKDVKDVGNPCQIPHTCMSKAVTQKYNGEILCIHNPPCVLINGCLNLPYPKPEPTVQATMWPVVECHRASFQHLFRKKSPKQYVEESCQYQAIEQACQYQPIEMSQYNVLEQSCQYQVVEQSCQYQPPSFHITDHSCQYYPETVNAYQITDHKREKIIQSSCNHKPPCEVKRTCQRPKYDPKLQTSCIHVPMCDNIPLCVLEASSVESGQSKKTCRHKPKCTEVPVCRRNYYIDFPKPANEEVGTQVRPRSKMICRHVPPCLMLPRCLERLCDEDCCQLGAIPDCVHQPMCEMIPACCRKPTKEMVSVCSQHPNSCRIV